MIKTRYTLLFILLSILNMPAQAVELEAQLGWANYQKIGFAVNGIIEGKVIDVGKKVAAGEVLAQLDTQPFNFMIEACQATVDKLEPAIIDAKLENDQAKELYERTVLSDVELQIIKGKYQSVISAQKEKKANCKLIKWQLNHATLKAKKSSYVLHSNLVSGMVISDENKSDAFIELVSATQASAIAWLNAKQRAQFNVGDNFSVTIDQKKIASKVKSIAMQPDKSNLYRLVIQFNYTQMIEPGKAIKINNE